MNLEGWFERVRQLNSLLKRTWMSGGRCVFEVISADVYLPDGLGFLLHRHRRAEPRLMYFAFSLSPPNSERQPLSSYLS